MSEVSFANTTDLYGGYVIRTDISGKNWYGWMYLVFPGTNWAFGITLKIAIDNYWTYENQHFAFFKRCKRFSYFHVGKYVIGIMSLAK